MGAESAVFGKIRGDEFMVCDAGNGVLNKKSKDNLHHGASISPFPIYNHSHRTMVLTL